MESPFRPARAPDRWLDVKREFPFGAHQKWIGERLFAFLVVFMNDRVLDLDVRTSPRLALTGRAQAKRRSLTISSGGVVRKRLTVRFDDRGVLIGENYIPLDGEGGVMRLVNALVDEVERVWNRQGW